MFIPQLRLTMSYEVRKSMHYLFYVFAIGMCFHNQTSAFPNGGFNQVVLGFCITYYTLDSLYVMFFMTEIIETTIFNVLPRTNKISFSLRANLKAKLEIRRTCLSGVQMTMAVSDSFQATYAQGGFGYVCLPWVSKFQWHAFSLFEHPTDPNLRQVFMMKVPGGDWTTSVHEQLQRNTVRPVWISGPFVSPYNNALNFDNTICVASGIGITPALSIIRAHKESRRINLVWMCRDSASELNVLFDELNRFIIVNTLKRLLLLPLVLEFFMDHLYLNNEGGWILIFFTGKERLSPAIENHLTSSTILIKRRPDLHHLIPNIIYGIESGLGVPESMKPSEKSRVKGLIANKVRELEASGFSEEEIIEELTILAHESGFLLSNMISEDDQSSRKSLLEVVKEHFAIHEPKFPEPATQTNGLHLRARRRRSRQGSLFRSVMLSNQINMLDSGYFPWENQEGAHEFVKGLRECLLSKFLHVRSFVMI
eukprot:CCRYP_014685-RA/>CCRYP_014685-RA protein AED:0.01 eAED:0.01 QI:801/0.66/0.75/1/1/1/4/491/480